jgi:hypothetical protein
MVVTVEGAEVVQRALSAEGVEYRVIDLNLDEIFEAYVAGKCDDAPPVGQPQVELQPLA